QFTTVSSLCPNCGIPLLPPQRGSLERNPTTLLLCNLSHPQFLADLKMALHRVGIPFNNANFAQKDYFVTLYYEAPERTDVWVLDSDFARAAEVLAQVLLYWQFDESIVPGISHDPREDYWPARAENNGLYSEDLQFLIWTGTNFSTFESIGMALREH